MISTSVGLFVISLTVAVLLLLNLKPIPQEQEEEHLRRATRRLRLKRPV